MEASVSNDAPSTLELAHDWEAVKLLRRGGEARIVLSTPENRNAWGKAIGDGLKKALEQVQADDSIRAVVITGEGKGFSSGADLKGGFDKSTPEGRPDLAHALHDRYHPVITGLRELPKPVLAAVNGGAVGVGCSLALAADIVVAKESAYFLLAFVNIGLVPDGGSSLFVPARAGFTRAMEMAMLGERVPAAQAEQWGLINRVFADDAFDAEVDALAQKLANGPTAAYAGAKRQLNNWLYTRMHEQLDLEAQIQNEMGGSEDFVEGVAAFLQKRTANFSGK